METLFSRLAALLLLGTMLPMAALAEKGVALVIGNGAYEHVPALTNPKNDAADMAATSDKLTLDMSRDGWIAVFR